MAEPPNEVKIFCSHCNAAYRIPDSILGKTVTCKKCGKKFVATAPVSKPEPYPLIGRIALESRLISQSDLMKAMSLQKAVSQKTGKLIPLEEILQKQGMISESKKKILVISYKRQLDKEFCRIAVTQSKISQNQAEQALAEQARRFKDTREQVLVCDILVESGAMSRQDGNAILREQGRKESSASVGPDQAAAGSGARTAGEDMNATAAVDTRAEHPVTMPPPAIESGEPNGDASEKIEVLKDKKFFYIRNKDKEFGKLIMEDNLATKGEVKMVLDQQLEKFQANGMRTLIGSLMVNEGILTRDQRDTMLIKQKRLMLNVETFGEIVLEKGYLTKEDLDTVAREQKEQRESGKDIDKTSELLAYMALLAEDQRDEIVRMQTDALPPPEDDDEEDVVFMEARLRDMEFQISVSKDGLRAYICRKTAIPADTIDIWDIKDLLMDHKIIYGIVDDSMLEGFLEYDGYENKKFKVAVGKPAKSGRPGRIKYYFETDHLKVGALSEDGQIDYKERGEIPHVPKGTLLAEKIPMIEGEQGIDVYGHPIHLESVRDISLKAGPGVELFEDGYKAFAKVDGQPDANFGGKISVLSELKIDGDVGYETGHVDFDGNVSVRGIILSGFRVRANSLKAGEIQEAEIELTGDLVVAGGMTDATINAQGDVKAKYLKNATIAAYGDVVIQKEIIDSKIDTSGMCIVKTGKIISSEIAAKKGIVAKQVGTDMSPPCTLSMGVDTHMDKEIEKINLQIAGLEKNREELFAKEQKLGERDIELQAEIAKYAHIQDRSLVEKRDLEKQIADTADKLDADSKQKMETYIVELDQRASDADSTINGLFSEQDKMEEEKSSITAEISLIESQINTLKDEMQEKLHWSLKQKQEARISISSAIYEGTKIIGRNASTTLEKDYKQSEIKEVRSDPLRGTGGWIIKVDK